MRPPISRFRRFAGYTLIALIWGVLGGLLAWFILVYALYADLEDPSGSRLTAGTGLEHVGGAIYNWFRSPSESMPDPELVYVPHPGAVRVTAPEYDVVMTVAPDGTREQPALEPPPRHGLVVVTGDSFAFGLGVGDHETYAALLQRRFGHATVNTGVISYGTARELVRLRRLGLLEKASMLVIQFCSNDGRENSDYVRDPKAPFARVDPSQVLVLKQKYQPHYAELTYGNVLNAVVRHVRYRVEAEGVRSALRDLAASRGQTLGSSVRARDNRTGETLAADFLGVLDLFPELAGKPIIAIELNDRGGSTGFTAALRRRAQGRPNLRVVDFPFQPEDFFRFDGHLTPRGHEVVAAGLDRAIREWRGASPGR